MDLKIEYKKVCIQKMKMLVLWITCLVPYFSYSEMLNPGVKSPTGIYLDTLENTIDVVLDEEDLPLYYQSEVFTPVCGAGECLPIRINLFWTLAGSYLKYNLPEGEILTKVEHIPFTEADYTKLDAVLRNRSSTLRYLLGDSSVFSEHVDGVTGPTSRASKRDFVEGAIYTSLTLYSLIYSRASVQLSEYTLNEFMNEQSVYCFLVNEDIEIAALAYTWLAQKKNEKELTELILERLDNKTEKYPQVAIRFLSPQAVLDSTTQNFLANRYLQPETSAESRTYLLKQWKGHQLLENTRCVILKGLIYFRADFELIVDIIQDQQNWSQRIYELLAEAIEEEHNMTRKGTLIRLLDERSKQAPKIVRKFLKETKKKFGI